MTCWRLLIFSGVTMALAAGTYLSASGGSEPTAGVPASAGLRVGLGTPESLTTEEVVRFWRDRADRSPRDYISVTNLGQALIQLAREGGDVSLYSLAESELGRALAVTSMDVGDIRGSRMK